MRIVKIQRLTAGSIFKLILFGSWVGSVPIFLVFGVFAAFGIEFLTWNGQYLAGWTAVLGGPLLGLFLSTMFGLIVASLVVVGHWIISKAGGLRLLCELDENEVRDDL
jgi:hypothetical protein